VQRGNKCYHESRVMYFVIAFPSKISQYFESMRNNLAGLGHHERMEVFGARIQRENMVQRSI
jgi:hypothetical protein